MARTQQERSEATRAALLDAAIACLTEYGYSGTTTLRVAERAGVSRGAHLHHFGTRTGLIGAAVREQAERFARDLAQRAQELPAGPDRSERALDLLWEPFSAYLFRGAVDLWAAGRTDPELRTVLDAIERDVDRGTLRLCGTLFPEHARRPGFGELMEFVIATIRGLALRAVLQAGEPRWPGVRVRLARVLDAELA